MSPGRGYREENNLDRAEHWVFWISMGTFAVMNLLIGYRLVHHAEQNQGVQFLLLFTLAMFFKFIVNDHGLHRHRRDLYDHIGRWIPAVAVFTGWAVNYWAFGLGAAAYAVLLLAF